MALVPRYINGKRDPHRTFTNTETGEIVSRYQELKIRYGGLSPKQHAQVMSGEYTPEGTPTRLYQKALKQFRDTNGFASTNDAERSSEWKRVSGDLFASYPNYQGKKHKEQWQRRIDAIQELWYDNGDDLSYDDFTEFVSPEVVG